MRGCWTLTLGLVVASPAAAAADGFGELAAGLTSPLTDHRYNGADTSLKFGLRGGWFADPHVAFEGVVDWIPVSNTVEERFGGTRDVSWHRVRVLFGVRVVRVFVIDDIPLTLFGRACIGADIVRIAVTGELGGETTNVGYSLEPGAGVLAQLGRLSYGLQFALPLSSHEANYYENREWYTGQLLAYEDDTVDIDVLLTASLAFE